MARNLVLKDGVLSAVVESYEQVELAQIQAEVEANQTKYDEAVTELSNTPAEAELLVNAATKRDEAKVALEDSKSDETRAIELVPESAVSSEPVHVDVQVADTEAQL